MQRDTVSAGLMQRKGAAQPVEDRAAAPAPIPPAPPAPTPVPTSIPMPVLAPVQAQQHGPVEVTVTLPQSVGHKAMTMRFRPEVHLHLKALSISTGQPAARMIEEAVDIWLTALPPEKRARLVTHAARHGMSLPALVERALDKWLDQWGV